MKRNILLLISMLGLICNVAKGQSTAITVGGDIDKFYPVLFKDNNWFQHKATVLEIGRSGVHIDTLWRGSTIAKFAFHTFLWGHRSDFIEADITSSVQPFIAGWHDATAASNSRDIIIWLRGGGTTYYLNSNTAINYEIRDGIQGALPYQEDNGPAHTYKEQVDSYVNNYGKSIPNTIYLNSTGENFIKGSLGIGTKVMAAGEKLSINGKIRAKEIKVEMANWPDYVFEESYQLPDLKETEDFIKTNKHLPGIPSAKEVEEHGVSLGEMNAKLLKKVEELTLHLIEKDKKLERLEHSQKLMQEQLNILNDKTKK